MSINIGSGVFIPGEGDVVRGADWKLPSYGRRGRITKTEEGQVLNYGCEYWHTVLWENGNIDLLNDQQVCFDHPKSLPVKP